MGRAKKRVRTVLPKGVKDSDWYSMFMQIMGTEVNMDIVYPKYIDMYEHLSRLFIIFSQFSSENGILIKVFPDLDQSLKEIRYFISEFRLLLGVRISFEQMKAEDSDKNSYKKLKESNYLKNLILLVKNLKQYNNCLECSTEEKYPGYVDKNLNKCEEFILLSPGVELVLFPFSSFELKHIWSDSNITDKIKGYILTCLNLIYIQSKKIVDLSFTADVNVKGFSGAVGDQLNVARKQIRGCDGAFNKIYGSLNMLEDNFDGYYLDVIRTQNPNMLVEGFISDVARKQDYDPKIGRQFKMILGHYKKKSKGKITDPRVNLLLTALGNKLNILEEDQDSDDDDEGKLPEPTNQESNNDKEDTVDNNKNTPESETTVKWENHPGGKLMKKLDFECNSGPLPEQIPSEQEILTQPKSEKSKRKKKKKENSMNDIIKQYIDGGWLPDI